MAAIGLFVLRMLIARPVGHSLRGVSIAFAIAIAAALLAAPVYLLLSTAQFSLRSPFDLGALAPLLDVSAFGRGYLRPRAVPRAVRRGGLDRDRDRPSRARPPLDRRAAGDHRRAARRRRGRARSPGVSGHAGQTSPRGVAIALDWLHLTAGAVWIGGLIGLLVLWRSLPASRRVAGLTVAVPRFSNVAHRRRAGADRHRHRRRDPAAADARVAVGDRLRPGAAGQDRAAARGAAAGGRQPPAHAPAAARRPRRRRGLLRRLVGGEAVVVAGAVFAAAVLTSLAPPAKAVADLGKPAATRRPGPGGHDRRAAPATRSRCGVDPNRAAVPNRFQVRLSQDGKPVTGARRHRELRHARHGDGHAGLQAARDRARAPTSARRPRW